MNNSIKTRMHLDPSRSYMLIFMMFQLQIAEISVDRKTDKQFE